MDSSARRTDLRFAVGLAVLFVLVYLLPLGARPVGNPDEFRYGEIAREMLASGDWISPRLNGVRYFEKPILGHWTNAAALKVLGQNAFALRLPAAIATGLTALLIGWLASIRAGRRTGLIAGGIYLTTFAVFGIGTTAVLDAGLAFYLAAAIGGFHAAHTCERGPKRLLLQLAWGVACGCAFLTKGFLAFVIPAIVIVPFLVIERRWRALATELAIPGIAAVVVALPWSLLIHAREPDFWRYFVVVEHLQRFAGAGGDVQHERPWWFFAAVLPIVAFPWTAFAGRAWAGLRAAGSDSRSRSLRRFLACWAIAPFLFFSASSGKLATYILPCIAPLAILLAIGLAHAGDASARRTMRWPQAMTSLVFAGSFLLVLAGQLSWVPKPVYGPDDGRAATLMLAALAFGAVASGFAMRAMAAGRQLTLSAMAVVPLFLGLCFALPTRIVNNKSPTALITSAEPVAGDALLVADFSVFNPLCWILGRDDIYVYGQSELDYGMAYADTGGRALDMAGLDALLRRYEGRRDIVLLMRSDREDALAGLLPPEATRSQRGDLVLWRIDVNGGAGG